MTTGQVKEFKLLMETMLRFPEALVMWDQQLCAQLEMHGGIAWGPHSEHVSIGLWVSMMVPGAGVACCNWDWDPINVRWRRRWKGKNCKGDDDLPSLEIAPYDR